MTVHAQSVVEAYISRFSVREVAAEGIRVVQRAANGAHGAVEARNDTIVVFGERGSVCKVAVIRLNGRG